MAITRSGKKDEHIKELFVHLFSNNCMHVTFVKARQFLQADVVTARRQQQSSFMEITTLIGFKALLFLHALSVVTSNTKRETFKMRLYYTTVTLFGPCVELMVKA